MRTVLRRPEFRLLFGGLLASMAAESILLLALAIWVKDLTGSDGLAGATIFAIIAPMVLAPLVGWAVDRYPGGPSSSSRTSPPPPCSPRCSPSPRAPTSGSSTWWRPCTGCRT